MANTTGPWQLYLNGLLIGDGTAYQFVDPGIHVSQEIRSHDLARLLADGDFQGPQFAGPIFIDWEMEIEGTSTSDLFAKIEALAAAWGPSSTDLTLEVNLPSTGSRTIQGRVSNFDRGTFGQTSSFGFLQTGVAGQFKAGTPTWT